jgi:hypothetical protein
VGQHVLRGHFGSLLELQIIGIFRPEPNVFSVLPAQVAIGSHALSTLNGIQFDSCVDFKVVFGKSCAIVTISDMFAIVSCLVLSDGELSILRNDRSIFSSVHVAVRSPSVTSLTPSGVFLGYNRFQISFSDPVLNPSVTSNNNTCSHVVFSIDSLIASCYVQKVRLVNRLVVEILDSNIPPMRTILRSQGIVAESVCPSIFTSTEVEYIFSWDFFPYVDVLASCWFGSIRSFLLIKTSSLASCEVSEGIVVEAQLKLDWEQSPYMARTFIFTKMFIVNLFQNAMCKSSRVINAEILLCRITCVEPGEKCLCLCEYLNICGSAPSPSACSLC